MFSVYFDPGNLLRHQLVVIIMDLINMGGGAGSHL